MGCFNSTPKDGSGNLTPAASNPLVKGATKPYGATGAGAGGAGAGSRLPSGSVSRSITNGGVTADPGRVVWIGHSAGSDRRHVGYDMLYRVLSIYCGAGSGLVVGDVVSSDPYARVRYQDKILSTDVKKSTLNPEWRQWLHFVGIESGGPWGNYLLHVLDHDVVGADDSLGGILVDITDADRKLRPKSRWIPLESTPSGQVNVITMAHKFGLMTVTLRKVTLMAETLGTNTPTLAVNVLHMNRTISFSESPVRTKCSADWAETQSFWASVDKDAPCILEVVARRGPDNVETVLASCQFLAREYVNVKGSLVSIPLHRGTAGGFGTKLAQLDVAIGQVVLEINVDGGGERGLATEQHASSLVMAVHHAAAALSSSLQIKKTPPAVMFYPDWQPVDRGNEESKVEVPAHVARLQTAMQEAGGCTDCGTTTPLPTWVAMAVDKSFTAFVCPTCIGVHRGVGADRVITKSVTLDPAFWTEERVAAAMEGRAAADAAGRLAPCCEPSVARDERDRAIRDKYAFDALDTTGSKAVGQAIMHLITVTVVRCQDLVNKDTLSLSDPYVVVQVGEKGGVPQAWRTTVKSNDLSPVYNERLQSYTWDGLQPMNISVMDSDVLYDDSLGHATVCLDGIPSSPNVEQEIVVPLQGVASGTVTLRILHYDYADMETSANEARKLLR